MLKEGDRIRVRADSTDWNALRWCRLHPDRTGYVYRVVEAYVCLDALSGVIPMADLELYIESAAVARFRKAYEAWNPNEPLVGLGAVEEAFLELPLASSAPPGDEHASTLIGPHKSITQPGAGPVDEDDDDLEPDEFPDGELLSIARMAGPIGSSDERRALYRAGRWQLQRQLETWAKRVIDWDPGSEVQGLPALLQAVELDLNAEHERALLAESNNDIAVELMAKEHATSIRCQARSAELERQVQALRSNGATPSYRVFHPTGRQSWFVYHAWLDYWCMVWDQIKPWRHGSYRLGGWGQDERLDESPEETTTSAH